MLEKYGRQGIAVALPYHLFVQHPRHTPAAWRHQMAVRRPHDTAVEDGLMGGVHLVAVQHSRLDGMLVHHTHCTRAARQIQLERVEQYGQQMLAVALPFHLFVEHADRAERGLKQQPDCAHLLPNGLIAVVDDVPAV